MLWFKKKQEQTRQPRLMAGQNDYVFRRSRTLTGSVSTEVTASAERLGQLKTDRLKLHELKMHRARIVRILLGTLVVCSMLGFLVVNFVIRPDIGSGQLGVNQPDIERYRQSIYAYFNDRPLERFGFLLRPTDLETDMKRRHAEVAGLAVYRDWYGGNVSVTLYFRQPLVGWRVNNQQFYVDAQGVAFTYNHFAEPSVAVTDKSGLPAGQEGIVASSRFIRFLGRMVGALNDYKLGRVAEVVLPPSTREIDLKLEGRNYLIKTNSDRDPLQQAEDIAFALRHLDSRGIKPQYVDLRVAHKAFYK
jgi:hypothetical protein